jgi:hypothetical protein
MRIDDAEERHMQIKTLAAGSTGLRKTVEVLDTLSAKTALHVNPLTPRSSMIKLDVRGRQ